MSCWLWNGLPFENALVYFGFVYIIKNELNGMQYIGKKLFSKAGTKQVKGKKKKIRKDSDWQQYWGSSPRLLAELETVGKENFSRTIVRLCKTRSECSYYETKMIFENDAILRDDYYNDWVSAKITRMHCRPFKNVVNSI
jgi:hypothetical protein